MRHRAAVHAQLLVLLAADPASVVLYDRDLVEERRKYANSILHRSEEHMSAQRRVLDALRRPAQARTPGSQTLMRPSSERVRNIGGEAVEIAPG